jgi:transcriptional regulator with XRE-family HTH domain
MSEKEINLTISKNLLKYLELKNRSQAELAEYVGVTQATVSNWCNGIKMPRMSKIDMICEFLEINRSDLMNDQLQDSQYYLNPETAQIAQEVFDNPDLRILFDAARDVSPDNIKLAAEMLSRFKKTNPDG